MANSVWPSQVSTRATHIMATSMVPTSRASMLLRTYLRARAAPWAHRKSATPGGLGELGAAELLMCLCMCRSLQHAFDRRAVQLKYTQGFDGLMRSEGCCAVEHLPSVHVCPGRVYSCPSV